MCADVCPSQARGLSQTFRMYAAIGHMLQQKRKTSYGLILIRPRSICIMDADNFRVRPIFTTLRVLEHPIGHLHNKQADWGAKSRN